MVLRLLLLACLFFPLQLQAEIHTLKFATLIPPKTAWMNIIDEWAEEVKTKTNGQVVFKMYPGGVMGDEPDVLRKIRSKQLHGGLFTGYGIGRIFSPARVLEVPFLFKNTDESDYVRDRIMPDLVQGFRKHGFELLGWPEFGFVHFFSRHPIGSIDEVKKHRIWLWQGDPLGEAFFSALDISPIPLSIMDVYPQLAARHGSIDTVYVTPFGALALQWYTQLKYATKMSVTNAIGAIVISNKFFDRLPDDAKRVLRETGAKASEKLLLNSRWENEQSLDLLADNGIEFMWGEDEFNLDEMIVYRDKAAKHLEKTGYIPAHYFQTTRTLLDEYRAGQKNNSQKE